MLVAVACAGVGCARGGDDLAHTGTTVGPAADDDGTTAVEDSKPTGSASTGSTVVISAHPACFDTYLSATPAVGNAHQYYVEPTSVEPMQLNQPWPNVADTTHGLFVVEDGQALAGVKFTYSEQDVLSVHEVRDAACEEVDWQHRGNELDTAEGGRLRTQRSQVHVPLGDGAGFDIAFEVVDHMVQPQGVVIRKSYQASVSATGS